MALRFSITSDNSEGFSFTCPGKDLDAALAKLNSALPTATAGQRNFLVIADKSRILLAGHTGDTYAVLEVPGVSVVQGSGAFGFDNTVLQGIIKGRGDLTFIFTGTDCSFKLNKGKYAGKFVVLPITSEQAASVSTTLGKPTKSDQTMLDGDTLDALREGLLFTAIRDVYSVEASLLTYLTLSAGRLRVACRDQYHLSMYERKVSAKSSFRLALPASHFLTIDKLAAGQPATFSIRPESLRVDGDAFSLVMPLTQVDDKSYEIVPDFIKALETPDVSGSVDVSKLSSLSDNLFTLHSSNTSFELTFKSKQPYFNIAFSTTHGTASDSLKIAYVVPGDLQARVEPLMFRNSISLLKEFTEVALSVKGGKWLAFETTTQSKAKVRVLCSLAA